MPINITYLKIWTWSSIINLQHIANLPHTFTENKDVTTSYYSCNQYATWVKVPNLTTLLPKWEQKGEKPYHMGFKFSYASADIEEMISSNCKCNSTSSWITQMDDLIQTNTNVHTILSVGHRNTLTPLLWEITRS
jgi:hypothetical protein